MTIPTKSAPVKPYKDPEHPGNKIRPRVRCWCFKCNVAQMDRISTAFRALCPQAYYEDEEE